MDTTNVNENSKPAMVNAFGPAIHDGIVLSDDEDSTSANAPRSILQSVLAALSAGRISEVVARFDDHFEFNDHALELEFTEKTRLSEFLQKSRDLFPDTTLELVSVMESGDHAVAEWRLAATQMVPFLALVYFRRSCS